MKLLYYSLNISHIIKTFQIQWTLIHLQLIAIKKTKHASCDDTEESKTKHGCVCTCCHKKNTICKHCVIFVKKNYDFKNDVIVHALENRYKECNNKEFICKPCHNKLKEG